MFSIEFFTSSFPEIAKGIPLTLALSFSSILFGTVLGLILAWIRIRNFPVVTQISRIFVSLFKSVPLIVVMYVLYFALPQIVVTYTGDVSNYKPLSPFLIATLTFGLFAGTCLEDVFRSAYNAVDVGQREAAFSIGLGKWRTFIDIIAPQALRSCLPNFTNTFIDVIKGTAIVYNISIFEIMGTANLLGSRKYRYIEVYLVSLILYLIICYVFYLLLKFWEKKLDY